MIGRIAGRIVSEDPTGALIVDVQGVGYELMTPVGTAGRVRGADGLSVFSVHTHVREDSLELFAFGSELERRVFRLLIAIPNVGPKTALGVMSALPPEELARAVDARDIVRLTKVPGIGKKTAERLALELRDKLPKEPGGADGAGTAVTRASAERLLDALTKLGYRPAEAERAVKSLGDAVEGRPLAELLREALRSLTP
jgi:Holliday junction DNA helicase RuvA